MRSKEIIKRMKLFGPEDKKKVEAVNIRRYGLEGFLFHTKEEAEDFINFNYPPMPTSIILTGVGNRGYEGLWDDGWGGGIVEGEYFLLKEIIDTQARIPISEIFGEEE